MRDRTIRLRWLIFSTLILVGFSGSSVESLAAQVGDQPGAPVQSPVPDPTPIPANDISARTASVRGLVRKAEAMVESDDLLTEIQEAFPAEQQRFDGLREQTNELVETSGRASLVKEVEKTTVRARNRLDRWMAELSERSARLESMLRGLQDERLLWEITRNEKREQVLPEALLGQVAEAIEVLVGGEENVQSAWDAALGLQANIAQQQSALIELLARQKSEIEERSIGIFEIDSPPLWRMTSGVGTEDRGAIDQITMMGRQHAKDVVSYAAEQKYPLLTWLLWFGLAVPLILMRRRAKAWLLQDPSLEATAAMLDRPITAAAVITLVASSIFYEQAPTAWIDVGGLLLLLTVLLLLLGTLSKALRPIPYLMIPLAILLRMAELAPAPSLSQRLALLALSVAGIACLVWFLRVAPADHEPISNERRRWVVLGIRIAILLLALGLITNSFGGVRLATLLVLGTVRTVFLAILLVVVTTLLRAMVRVALMTPSARSLGIAPDHSETVRRALFRTIAIVITLFWVMFTLRAFTLYEFAVGETERVLQAQWSIGNFSINPGNLLVFVFMIWLSIKLGALVEFVVEALIAPRLDLPQGAPQTFSRVSRYLVIVIGFVVAFSAIGLDVSKVALVAGGLGVGVGFGLQNVVNNFISGLILLFERPIRVGDIIELGNISGVVENVGMRATLVRTWRGSELIVPNANLISSEVINQTLKHDWRRIEIPVGVDYNSDPEEVAAVLISAADEHPKIRDQPKPGCLFTGFGESTLDFELRGWANARNCFEIDSELRFAITRKLREAGITIPIPQRDLFIRNTHMPSPEDLTGVGGMEERPPEIPEGDR
ncbi:MAG: hypothetical protein DRJ61_12970 [Acidobacteria bacterium]|nr:MAG: hypothetical protein DRJ61_12970 [Acidobacteriota bacterium]